MIARLVSGRALGVVPVKSKHYDDDDDDELYATLYLGLDLDGWAGQYSQFKKPSVYYTCYGCACPSAL